MSMNIQESREALERILTDKTSGSSDLARAIEKLFPLLPDDMIESAAEKILCTHSSMAAVINAVNRMCLYREGLLEKPGFPGGDNNQSADTFQRFWQENHENTHWVTLSMSRWVIDLFAHSPQPCQVDIGISAPGNEGLKSAEILGRYHRVTIFEDSALCTRIKKAAGVILGADLLSSAYVVNKMGSFSLALAARYFNRPYYMISSGDKYLPAVLLPFYRIKTDTRGNHNVQYFEEIPATLVTRVYLASSPCTLPLSKMISKIISKMISKIV